MNADMTFDQGKWMRAPSARARLLSICVISILQLACIRWAGRTALAEMASCQFCDTSYYLTSANEIVRSGLLFVNYFDGYRSYFVPLFVAAAQKFSSLAGFGSTDVERYVYGVCCLFWLFSIGAMWWVSKRVSSRQFLFAAAATIANPFLVVYVPFALQEGVLIALCLPLLFVWVGARDLAPSARAVLVVTIALIAYIVRASLVWWLLPAALYAVWIMKPNLRQPRRWMPPLLFVAFAGVLLLGPQVYIAKQKFDSFNPYPRTAVLSNQIIWGISLLKFASVEDHGHWRQLAYLSPFVAEADDLKTIQFYVDNPSRGILLLLGHAYSGFHYDQIMPYWRVEKARSLTLWLLLSSAIVFLGMTGMAATVLEGRLTAESAFSIGTVALCCAALMFTATESRFGIVGFAMLSVQALQLLANRPTRAQWSYLLPGLLLYLALSFLFNALMMQNADIGL
jgi:hypothetical protein